MGMRTFGKLKILTVQEAMGVLSDNCSVRVGEVSVCP